MIHFSQKNKVLLLGGDATIASAIKDYFNADTALVHATHAKEIEENILLGNWDLVITDVNLPNLNDINISKLVKEVDPYTSVLIVTQDQKIDFILTALQDYADGLEFKPLERNKFLEVAYKLIATSQEKRKKEKKIILAIGAHPDDVELGCGGALALHRSKRDHINILTLSLGDVGGDPMIRQAEAREAAKQQGANLLLRNLKDTKISEGIQTIEVIEEVVNTLKPTHIYTHSLHDIHKDHRSVHLATLSASRDVPNLYCFQSPSSSVDFKPNLFIELCGEFLEKKLVALSCYKSQCDLRAYLKQDMIRATAQYWGRFANYGYVEPMEVMRQKLIMG